MYRNYVSVARPDPGGVEPYFLHTIDIHRKPNLIKNQRILVASMSSLPTGQAGACYFTLAITIV